VIVNELETTGWRCWQHKSEELGDKTAHSATLSTKNPTWSSQGSRSDFPLWDNKS